MDLQVAGKKAFISGSSGGISYAISAHLAAEGADVVLHGRTTERVHAAVVRLRAEGHGVEVSGVAGDMSDDAQAEQVARALGAVDVLVNHVGAFDVRPFADVTDDEWRRYYDVNVISAVRLSRGLLPGMLERGWGRIVLVSSESGINVPDDMIHYGVSKAAMLAPSNGLAKLTRGTEVTVNAIVGAPRQVL